MIFFVCFTAAVLAHMEIRRKTNRRSLFRDYALWGEMKGSVQWSASSLMFSKPGFLICPRYLRPGISKNLEKFGPENVGKAD